MGMKKFLLATLLCLASLTTQARMLMGNEAGHGGSGDSFLFAEIAQKIFNYLDSLPPTSPYLIPFDLRYFRQALRNTMIVGDYAPVYNKLGYRETAIYFSPDELREKLRKKGFTEEQIAKAVDEKSTGLIQIDYNRFEKELKSGVQAYATVMHEFERAMNYNENNYHASSFGFDTKFFLDVIKRSDFPIFKVEFPEEP